MSARRQEDMAILDAIRNAVGGGPYDTIATRVAELVDKVDSALTLGWSDTAARELRAALARVQGGAK